MKHIITSLAVLCIAGPALAADTIERACNKSDRRAVNRTLCGCIQDVADIKLTMADQMLAATFFDDPHLAQVTRQSDDAAKERFWKRYKDFGKSATDYCS